MVKQSRKASKFHDCGNGYRGMVRTANRPGGYVRFCDFCGHEFGGSLR